MPKMPLRLEKYKALRGDNDDAPDFGESEVEEGEIGQWPMPSVTEQPRVDKVSSLRSAASVVSYKSTSSTRDIVVNPVTPGVCKVSSIRSCASMVSNKSVTFGGAQVKDYLVNVLEYHTDFGMDSDDDDDWGWVKAM
mmetsp:Transcript_9997/g.22725  ORF Transcript_9997/g.22725 Transcript_9997/m.22725 type:complete len:137 (-) Transcript_9997:262-672(-)